MRKDALASQSLDLPDAGSALGLVFCGVRAIFSAPIQLLAIAIIYNDFFPVEEVYAEAPQG